MNGTLFNILLGAGLGLVYFFFAQKVTYWSIRKFSFPVLLLCFFFRLSLLVFLFLHFSKIPGIQLNLLLITFLLLFTLLLPIEFMATLKRRDKSKNEFP